MITLFTTNKPFVGLTGIRQKNAVRSWSKLTPKCEIIIIGDELGSAELASEIGAIHVPKVERNEKGTPLIASMFDIAAKVGKYDIQACINADILLFDDFLTSTAACQDKFRKFMMVGQRVDIDLDHEVDFDAVDWRSELIDRAEREGRKLGIGGSDYFVYPRGLIKCIPGFAVGRPNWDNWMMFAGRYYGGALIDATETAFTLHPNHDYSHAGGRQNVFWGSEFETAQGFGDSGNRFFHIGDATYRLERDHDKLRVVRRPRDRRYFQTLPTVRPYLKPVAQAAWAGLRMARAMARVGKKKTVVSGSTLLAENPVKTVCVIGLKNIGASLAAFIGSKGYTVIGVDSSEAVSEKFALHVSPVDEPGLQELLTANRANIFATASIKQAIERTELSFITNLNADSLVSVCGEIGNGLKSRSVFHVVAITDKPERTVSMSDVIDAIEQSSGQKSGKDFGVCYAYLNLNDGAVFTDLAKPQSLEIFESDKKSGVILRAFLATLFSLTN